MERVDALLQLREVLLVDQALDELWPVRIVLALAVDEALDELQALEELLDLAELHLRGAGGGGLRRSLGRSAHGSSAEGMRARMSCDLRASHAVSRWRS